MLETYMGASPKWAVVAVDLDGTLIHGTTASLHLGEWIGHRAIIEELPRIGRPARIAELKQDILQSVVALLSQPAIAG